MAQVDMINLEKTKMGRFFKAFDKGVCSHFSGVSWVSHTQQRSYKLELCQNPSESVQPNSKHWGTYLSVTLCNSHFKASFVCGRRESLLSCFLWVFYSSVLVSFGGNRASMLFQCLFLHLDQSFCFFLLKISAFSSLYRKCYQWFRGQHIHLQNDC